MRKKVYISGKIGEEVLSDATREKFAKAEALLKSKGYDVFNPTNSGFGKIADERVLKEKELGHKTSWYAEIMKLDLMALSFCDTICMLADWTDKVIWKLFTNIFITADFTSPHSLTIRSFSNSLCLWLDIVLVILICSRRSI